MSEKETQPLQITEREFMAGLFDVLKALRRKIAQEPSEVERAEITTTINFIRETVKTVYQLMDQGFIVRFY